MSKNIFLNGLFVLHTMKFSSDFHDYVIKDGKLVGEFEQMYQDHESPWNQVNEEQYQSDKAVTINKVLNIHATRDKPINVLELGCGLGYFTDRIRSSLPKDCNVMGIDVSSTAISTAKRLFPDCKFKTADILDFDVYRKFKPDIILMPQITWYVLEKLKSFLDFLKSEFIDTILIHNLIVYPKGIQKYGKEYFTNIDEILKFFDMNYQEYGSFYTPTTSYGIRTYFVGTFKK